MCNKMSDVRLSNASPTLERVDARQPDNVRPSVRRNLFGRPDPAEIQRNVTASIQEDVQGFTEKYNFDPVNERPLAPLNYVWQEDRNAPEFYVRQPHGSQRPQRDEDFPGDNNRQDAETRSERQSDQPRRDGSRKRRSETSGDLPRLIKAATQFCFAVPQCRGAKQQLCPGDQPWPRSVDPPNKSVLEKSFFRPTDVNVI